MVEPRTRLDRRSTAPAPAIHRPAPARIRSAARRRREEWREHVISFTEHDIEKLTSNYSTLIGKGGFGEVFRGIIDDEDDVVAVKKYIRGDLREDFMEEVDKSGKAMFDKDITAEEDISALEEIGRLALECVRENINERPTMKEVAERLKMIRRAWIRQIRELTETEATKAVEDNITTLRDLGQGDDNTKLTIGNYGNIRSFTEHNIERITSNYSTPVGKGGFGEVFRGVLDDDHGEVAVKRYIHKDLREEFMEEVRIHSKLNHKNVAKLIGYCLGENTLTMVTEFIPNGNLDEALHNSDLVIPLDTRLGIAIGCAQALTYMHSMHLCFDSLVCHGDIKPANILLDENLIAKVSDFGLSRLLAGGITQYTSIVKGSMNYVDPIYIHTGRLTPRSDVYSFGIVLLELITRRTVKMGRISLVDTFNEAFANGKMLPRELFDAGILKGSNVKILENIAKLATKCLTLDINKRPRINDVRKHLLILWKDLRGDRNLSLRFFRRTENKLEVWNEQAGTNNVSSTSSMLRLLGISKRISSNSETPRFFTKGELREITKNYSYPIGRGWSSTVYKGTLEDNTMVSVMESHEVNEAQRQQYRNASKIQTQTVHKNMIKLLGCCVEEDALVLVYEYAAKGNVSDILHGQEDFPPQLRLTIAAKTAEALAYLHASSNRHGCVMTLNILLDNNFVPKIAGFSVSRRFINDKIHARFDHEIMNYVHPVYSNYGIRSVKSDVYSFGVVLLELISMKKPVYREREHCLVSEFFAAYKLYGSGEALFDERIKSEQDMVVLEKMGRLALECTCSEVDQRPAMEEVAGRRRRRRVQRPRVARASVAAAAHSIRGEVMIELEGTSQKSAVHPQLLGISQPLSVELWRASVTKFPENKCIIDILHGRHSRDNWTVDDNHNIKSFTEDDIERITSKYSTRIGKGGFGEVFRGFLDDEDNVVAVKRYINCELIEQFMKEVGIHSQIDHKNTVKLIGYCVGESTLTMVTEFISNRNLDDALHNNDISIPFITRLDIAIGSAEALSYMHSIHLLTGSLVCHGDIKPANILLDQNLTAKVSDFGLSRFLSCGTTRYTMDVKGSYNYADPIYLQKGCLTLRSDVYSFGVVLLELITRKRGTISLIDTFSKAFAKGRVSLREIFDAQIVNDSNLSALEEIGKLTTDCLTLDIDRRPKMHDVAKQLIIIWKGLRGGQEIGWSKKLGLGIFNRNAISSKVLLQLGNNVRIFTGRELIEVTQNYSCLLHNGQHAAVYKGSLEDNTLVAVKRCHKHSSKNEYLKNSVANEATTISHVPHKNIIRLLGCCLESDIPILVYEYASKGTLAGILYCSYPSKGNPSDVVYSGRYFPLALHLEIAA
uniref:Protein kinase domain-containing protein n=1 Tax=Leersia perrieri TaxID=77586 RepID=A0A0D9XT64_9ORYZ